jgi:hypothetical protein
MGMTWSNYHAGLAVAAMMDCEGNDYGSVVERKFSGAGSVGIVKDVLGLLHNRGELANELRRSGVVEIEDLCFLLSCVLVLGEGKLGDRW